MDRIYTGRGDTGETGLLYGGRVSKNDPRCEAYGTVDEAVSALGLARALCKDSWVKEVIKHVQRELFIVGAELATDPAEYHTLQRHFPVVLASMVEGLERVIDEFQGKVEISRAFIIPGASPGSGALDLARAVLRRAERRVVGLSEAGLIVNPELLRYLNRLSTLLFVLSRYEDRDLPVEKLMGDEER